MKKPLLASIADSDPYYRCKQTELDRRELLKRSFTSFMLSAGPGLHDGDLIVAEDLGTRLNFSLQKSLQGAFPPLGITFKATGPFLA